MSSTVIAKNIQVGTSGTATNNFNWYQPASPDGTVRLGVGNYGATTLDAVTVSNSGNVTVSGSLAGGALSGSSLAVSGATTTGSLTVNSNAISAVNSLGFRNRILNGDCRIDQRNAGASVTPTADGTYTLDRWQCYLSQASKYSVQQNAGSVTPPAGFTNYLGITSTSAYSVLSSDYFAINQRIEGFNFADLGWGAAGAQPVTISFWVRSSLTGTFGGSIVNSAENRSYPFSYTVSAANTWEQKTVTVTGDTSGTWVTNNGIGARVYWAFGVGSTGSGTAGAWTSSNLRSATGAVSVVGTNGATFYITGVQLEAGTVASPFERRDYGRELAMCQRYFFKTYAQDVAPGTASGGDGPGKLVEVTNNYTGIQVFFPVTMRASPTITVYNPITGSTASMRGDASNFAAAATRTNVQNTTVYANNVSIVATTNVTAHVTAAIEL